MPTRPILRAMLLALAVAPFAVPSPAYAQAPATQPDVNAPRTFWYFYRVTWGYQEEFVRLYQKNHYPILKAEMERGRIISMKSYVPTFHGDGRADWTFAVELTFRSMEAFLDDTGSDEIIRRLYPDRETYLREEARRFEILDAHWDVPLNEVEFE